MRVSNVNNISNTYSLSSFITTIQIIGRMFDPMPMRIICLSLIPRGQTFYYFLFLKVKSQRWRVFDVSFMLENILSSWLVEQWFLDPSVPQCWCKTKKKVVTDDKQNKQRFNLHQCLSNAPEVTLEVSVNSWLSGCLPNNVIEY